MGRYLATSNFRHCVAGEVYELDPDEWWPQIEGELLIPYPADEDAPRAPAVTGITDPAVYDLGTVLDVREPHLSWCDDDDCEAAIARERAEVE